MAGKSKVWFVDDLPRNLEKFAKNHAADFDVTTFLSTDAVLKRIVRGDLPDALLCDVFFYDTVQEAERVERKIDDLADQLRDTANEIGVIDHTRALGIRLMEKVYEHFGNRPPPFPMYAYTSKGPFLLEQKDWENISKYGAEILLKNRVSPQTERIEIEGDIALHRQKRSWLYWLSTSYPRFLWAAGPSIFGGVIVLLIGKWLRGTW